MIWGATAMILVGILAMCQPFTFWLYPKGFALLGIGTILYIFSSHIKVEKDGESSGK
jgi:hypothetical protein